MQWTNLWAPWRIGYIRSIPAEGAPMSENFLRDAFDHPEEDRRRLVLYREEAGLIMMNRFPYTSGHLLVAPARVVADLTDVSAPERARLMEMVVIAERIIQITLNPNGINVGINMGRAAGAGVPHHVHIHLVPRWAGDTNFMHVVGSVRVIPQALEDLYEEMLAIVPRVVGA